MPHAQRLDRLNGKVTRCKLASKPCQQRACVCSLQDLQDRHSCPVPEVAAVIDQAILVGGKLAKLADMMVPPELWLVCMTPGHDSRLLSQANGITC